MIKIFFILLLFKNYLFAFTLNNSIEAKFSKDEVKVNVASNTCINIGYTNQDILELTKRAINEYWNSVTTSRLRLKQGSIVEKGSAFYTGTLCTGSSSSICEEINPSLIVDRDVLIACNDNATDFPINSGILGKTLINNISGQDIKGAIFLINDTYISGTSPNPIAMALTSDDDMVAFIAHELGHAIGLGHSPVTDSLMYFKTVPKRRYLGWDDVDGVTYLYPMDQPLGCGSIYYADSASSGGDLIGSILIGVISSMMLISFIPLIQRFNKFNFS